MAFECLFLNDPADNVATALDNLKAHSLVPVIRPDGIRVGELKVRAHVPIYFKVNVRDLWDGEPIIKLGATIGLTVARTVTNTSTGEVIAINQVVIPAGSPIHDTNFIITHELWQAWGASFAHPCDAISELQLLSRQAPFKVGKALRNIAAGDDIHLSDVELHDALRRKLFDGLLVSDQSLIGRALTRIPQYSYLRLGCCVEKKWDLPIRPENVNVLIAAYRHSKRLVS
jgi:hypothetical protein